jgi:Kef-type K+ transport system membrane component KefB
MPLSSDRVRISPRSSISKESPARLLRVVKVSMKSQRVWLLLVLVIGISLILCLQSDPGMCQPDVTGNPGAQLAGAPQSFPETPRHAPTSFVYLLFELSLILTAAKFGGWVARKIGLPVVLGELFAGVVLGNMTILGTHLFEGISRDPSVATLAELGVILLMFEVGVESTVAELLRVGKTAFLVAMIGTIAPFSVGVGTVRLFFPSLSLWVDIFLGATLCATSVGISARVLKDLGQIKNPEGKTILGAAVVDDVFGLIILAVVVAVIGTATSSEVGFRDVAVDIFVIILKAFGFLILGIVLGLLLTKRLFRWAASIKLRGMLLTLSLTLCFSFSYLAHLAGLAPIVGAFAAGLILEPEHSRFFFEQEEEYTLEHLLTPLSTVFVPIFFLYIGMQVDLTALISGRALLIGGLLSAAAIFGKMVCAAGVFLDGGETDPWTVAIGMIPRGEVGLIFASLGMGLEVKGTHLLNPTLYAAIILMVFVTTAITPPFLEQRLGSVQKKKYRRKEEQREIGKSGSL